MIAKEIYKGSNGEATKAFYQKLEALGPIGLVAINLFRAQKCSSRAKEYSRRYKGDAYDRKNWSMRNLCDILTKHAAELNLVWGWKVDPAQEFHKWVLYVDLPTGQVSFHSATRMDGPDYPGDWDLCHLSAERIIVWVQSLLDGTIATPVLPLTRETWVPPVQMELN